ncbi:3-oxoacyl-[acyl-carrier-protein] synthase III C-terminal domain-containing protein [Microbacterium amylolyticum]|uniref:Naringenin-chalcone synthase n=1 Tax=Microbacterium amylolyticum TaxID=936337 RepID=A0ABS4ZGE4_9MICO|nr:putative naringenin-chalcone synthase [Microbacterium amylolyticum]
MDQTAVRDFFADQPGAVVLVVCTDLCSLHLRTSDDPEQIDAWAVHPGERSILDRVQSGLDLPDSAPAPSREVLRETGNMSSATVLFILQRILDDSALPEGARVAGVCFGPGLTVESARLTLRDAQT